MTRRRRSEKVTTERTYPSALPSCVKAKGREEAHRNGRGKERSCKATISFDYKTFGQEDDLDDKATAIEHKDDHTKMIFGHGLRAKASVRHVGDREDQEDIARLGRAMVNQRWYKCWKM